MYGAILGDMIGAPYEFDMGDKTKLFPLFGRVYVGVVEHLGRSKLNTFVAEG